ncbi:hypothetical protein AKJ65_02615 [candidate division MSBL1 archaeon SCGC-AAA259E19]|uniref:Uncharacterized protein n=1 Tax=candidate division MSBL1 archaeon SCGC-AAA259E19 TaxID=1698264 RepID=A0A133ULI8_9EURY|nr:hypothetical protein AKJ65_02615 [candidate division MSBL1 archaeon SCGC-AAA259E19]
MISLDEMKRRILKAHKYREDLVEPLSEVLDLEEEKVVDLIIEKLDMLRLQGLQARWEKRRKNMRRKILDEKINIDLFLPMLVDFLSIVNEESARRMKEEVIKKVLDEDKEYKKALKEAKKELRKEVVDSR